MLVNYEEVPLFTKGVVIYWNKNTPRSHYSPVNNDLEVFFPVK